MKQLVFTLLMMLGLCGPAFSQSGKLLIGGSGNQKIYIIDKKTGNVEWTHNLDKGSECNSVAATKDGKILFSYRGGARLVGRNHKTIWDFPAPKGAEIQMVAVLPDGKFLIGQCSFPSKFIKLNKRGVVVGTTNVDLGSPPIMNIHGQFRQVIRNSAGNYVIPVLRLKILLEVNPEGETVREYDLQKGRPFSVVQLKNGNYIVPCGDDKYIIEVDKNSGEIVRKIDAIEGVNLQYPAQVVELANGNLLICNWGGHSGKASGNDPQMFELGLSGKVVWKLDQHDKTGNISAVYVIK